MNLEMLKCKIHRATVTQAELQYVGSITIDEDLMDDAGLVEYEKVQIADIENGERFETYVIAGSRGTGVICINGAAARKVAVGDKLIIMAYAYVEAEEARAMKPRVVLVDEKNRRTGIFVQGDCLTPGQNSSDPLRRVLITSGGTVEPIDRVRSVTNHSTGRLGAVIADKFLLEGWFVTYVCTAGSVKPRAGANLKTVTVTNVESVVHELKNLLQETNYNVIVHAMAVSDYSPYASLPGDGLALACARLVEDRLTGKDLCAAFENLFNSLAAGRDVPKISSNAESLITFMRKTPKVIASLKLWSPDSVLVGFKMLVDAPHERLLKAAHDLIVNNKCDFVLANDLNSITDTAHTGYLVDQNGVVATAHTRKTIAGMIYERVNELTS
jgi:phosphopantothenate-cysteine ligase